ncbi:STAS domain-containing protein [Actinomadura sp. OS1-43]|nr:STAS domain-containing protein [Actinomadura sp. OS1-43]
MQQIGSWLVVEVTGELDLATAPGLLARVGRLIALTASPCIALEMSGVTFCDSSGINAVVQLWKRTRAADGQIMVLCPRPRLAELLARTGVDSWVRVVDSLPPTPEPAPEPGPDPGHAPSP